MASMRLAHVDSQEFHRAKAEFDRTKAGVKGIADSGVSKIPNIFIHPPENLRKTESQGVCKPQVQVPVIDLEGLEGGNGINCQVREIREAAEKWGVFQVVKHGIPVSVMDEMLEGVQRFHEQPTEVKMKWYSREVEQQVKFYSNGDLYHSKAVNWRDSVSCRYADGVLDPHVLPLVSRGFRAWHSVLRKPRLHENRNSRVPLLPPCPEPDLTLGATKHSDPSFLTILLQDSIGGLQVLQGNQWVDVKPVKGALIVNIGDLMQLVSNDKFKSVEHRVLVAPIGPRISAACFFYPSTANNSKPYGPIKELISAEGGPVYRETDHNEYMSYYRAKGLDGTSTLSYFKL